MFRRKISSPRPTQQFSATRFLNLLAATLQGSDYQKIQSCLDIYSATDDSSEADEPELDELAQFWFSSQEQNRLDYYAYFYTDNFVLAIGDSAAIYGGMYTGCFKDERDAAAQIALVLLMASTGQIQMLQTLRSERWCALELLLYTPRQTEPVVISTVTNYPKRLLKSTNSGYTVNVLSNGDTSNTSAIPKEFFICDFTTKGDIEPHGRSIKSEFTPLTKGDFDFVAEHLSQAESGIKPHETDWMFYYRNWEFWVLSVIGIGGIAWLYLGGIIPEWGGYNFVIAPIIAIAYRVLLIDQLLTQKEKLRSKNPDHPWLNIDAFMKHILPTLALTLFGVFSLWLASKPIFAINAGSFESLYGLADMYTVIWAIPIAISAGIAIGWREEFQSKLWAGLIIATSNVALLAVNIIYTNTGIDTPEPYASITIYSIVSCVFLIPTFGFYLIKHAYEYRQDNQTRDIWEIVAKVLQFIFVTTNLLGSIAILIASYRLRTHLEPSMLRWFSPGLYSGLVAGAGIALILASLLTVVWQKALSPLYWLQVAMTILVFGLFGGATTDEINNLENTTWLYLFLGIFIPLFVGSFYNFSKEYLDRKRRSVKLFIQS